MAAHTSGDTPSPVTQLLDGECLSDDQIKILLHEAEGRLRQNLSLQAITLTEKSMTLPKFNVDTVVKPYIKVTKSAARVESSSEPKKQEQNLAERITTVETRTTRKQRVKQEKEATAGPNWFNLPRTNLTPELKRDLQLLNLRSVLDPKRHYKKQNSKAGLPAFSQVGTIIESPAEYYSARLLNRERKRTLAEEVLAVEAENHRFKTAYARVQSVKTSGKKEFYNARKAKRSGRLY